MNKRRKQSTFKNIFSILSYGAIITADQISEYVYKYVELPLQNACCYFGNISLCNTRQRTLFRLPRHLSEKLVQSYIITFFLYFILLFFAQIFSHSLQRYYFIDPLLSNDRQCINIQFVRIDNNDYNYNNTRLKENFIRENFIIGNESYRKDIYDYTQLHQLLNVLENNHYIICQRSLYLYARFHAYSKLLHSNYSQFRFFMSKYPSSFSIDQPPFLDLCVHTFNRSQTEHIKSYLLSLSSHYYTSVNLFFFNFNFTQVSVTLYELNDNSTHLERISIHSGWLRDTYSQFYFFKYDDALSTVLFDGFAREQQFVDYFDYKHIPVPADSLLGLNEMIQRTLLILPLCESARTL
jgi:hypothetical protein